MNSTATLDSNPLYFWLLLGICSSWRDTYHTCNVLSSVLDSNVTLIVTPILFIANVLNIPSPIYTYFMWWLLLLSCARLHSCPYEFLGNLTVQSGVRASHFFFGHWPLFLLFLWRAAPLPLFCATTSSLNSVTVLKVPCSFLQTLFLSTFMTTRIATTLSD